MDWSLHGNTNVSAAATVQDGRLKTAAHQFEASLMAEVMKPLQEDSLFSDESDGTSSPGGGSSNALTGFASEALGRCLSEHGGFGIARQILSHLEPAGSRSHPAKNTPVSK